jgi:putative membrane protein
MSESPARGNLRRGIKLLWEQPKRSYNGEKISDERKGMRFLAHLLINMATIMVIAYLFPRLIWVEGWFSALAAAFLLGVVNAIIRPIFILLTLPLTILTLGLFLLVINALMLWLVAVLVGGFHVNGFWGAFFGSILISLVSWILSRLALPP